VVSFEEGLELAKEFDLKFFEAYIPILTIVILIKKIKNN
jgi:hypothetical protein